MRKPLVAWPASMSVHRTVHTAQCTTQNGAATLRGTSAGCCDDYNDDPSPHAAEKGMHSRTKAVCVCGCVKSVRK